MITFSQTKVPTVFSNDAVDGGTAWANPNQAGDTSGDGASCNLAGGASSQWLMCSGFGFDIPLGARITGNEVQFWDSCTVLGLVQMDNSTLLLNGVRQTVNAIVTPVLSILSFVASIWGGGETLLAESITVNDVNASDYGISLKASNIGVLPSTMKTRQVTLTVYYQLPVIQPMGANGGVIGR